MDRSKTISVGQLFYMVLLFQQSGLFWLLPYFLVRGNGTIGLGAIAAGAFSAVAIILIGRYWYSRCTTHCGFVTALQQRSQSIGAVVGVIFVVFYLAFTIVSLYSFVDVTQKQLLEETPPVLLYITVTAIVGIMSWGGLEIIARMSVLSMAALVIMAVMSVAGTIDLFVPENGLPLQLRNVEQLREAMMHSVFCYSGLLSLFMLYPAINGTRHMTRRLLLAVGVGTLLPVLWATYALCIFGQYSLQTILWIPAHLARMVQISSFVEQTESLFVVLWMTIVLSNGSLLLWCASQGMHQLLRREKTMWIHSGTLLLLYLGMTMLHNSMELLQLEAILARGVLFLLPMLLLSVVLLTPKRRKRT